jgi:proline iminopeptidase
VRAVLLAVLVVLASCSRSAAPRANTCSREHKLRDGGELHHASDGVDVWFKLAGRSDAPVVAFLHGGPGYNSYVFEKSAGRRLEQTLRVLYFDQRGCGRSAFDGSREQYGMVPTVRDLEELRVALGIEKLSLIGHSFGGRVAEEYARKYSDHVDNVIMIDTAPNLGAALAHQIAFVDSIAERAFPEHAAAIHSIARSEGPEFPRLGQLYATVGRLPLQERLHFGSVRQQRAMEAIDEASGLLSCTSGAAVRAFEEEGFLAQRPTAARLPVRAMLIGGTASQVIGRANIEAAAAAWNAELRWLDGGHFVYFDLPDELARMVTEFVTAR